MHLHFQWAFCLSDPFCTSVNHIIEVLKFVELISDCYPKFGILLTTGILYSLGWGRSRVCMLFSVVLIKFQRLKGLYNLILFHYIICQMREVLVCTKECDIKPKQAWKHKILPTSLYWRVLMLLTGALRITILHPLLRNSNRKRTC